MTAIPLSSTRRSPSRSALRPRALLNRAVETVCALDRRDVAARLTLLLLVLYSGKYWDVKVPIAIVAAVGMVIPTLSRRAAYWVVITLVMGYGAFSRLYTIDNHKVLMAYWTLALALSMRDSENLALNARRLIGLCFLFGTYWKVATPGFVNGSFLHHTFVTDSRFSNAAAIAGGISPAVHEQNQAALTQFHNGGTTEVLLSGSSALDLLAQLATWWTILVEGSIALTFLAPVSWRALRRVRNLLLLMFIGCTYSIATVIGFGWLLAIMGYAQTTEHERKARIAYLVVFLVLQLYLVPWSAIAATDW